MEQIHYPTGGYEEFAYAEVDSLAAVDKAYAEVNRGVTTHKVYESVGATAAEWTYSADASDNNYRVSVVAPDGMQTDNFMHRGHVATNCANIVGDGDNSVRKQFTGYERDNESGLDFAQARMFANQLGRFTSVDPANKILRADPQSWNKYVYAFNSPFRFVDKDGRWPTRIHNLIFTLSLPGLSKQQLDRIKQGSWDVDFPKTVIARFANEHGMCRPGQGPSDCATGNLAAAQKNFDKAIDLRDTDPLQSKYFYGRGMHSEQDPGSPSHQFQVYDDTYLRACFYGDLLSCALYTQEAYQHKNDEDLITPTQLQQQISLTQMKFKNLYGDAALKDAMGIFAGARFIFDGPLDGRSLPTLDLGDLGVVTVHADGTQDYEGILNKIQ